MIPHDVDALTSMSCLLVLPWIGISCGIIGCKSNTAHHQHIDSLNLPNWDNDAKPNKILFIRKSLQHAQLTKTSWKQNFCLPPLKPTLKFTCRVIIYTCYVCMSVYIYLYTHTHLFRLSVYLSVCLPVSLSVRLSACLPFCLSACLSVHLIIHLLAMDQKTMGNRGSFMFWCLKPWEGP